MDMHTQFDAFSLATQADVIEADHAAALAINEARDAGHMAAEAVPALRRVRVSRVTKLAADDVIRVAGGALMRVQGKTTASGFTHVYGRFLDTAEAAWTIVRSSARRTVYAA